MSKNVRFNYVLPTTREDGSPLAVSDIAYVDVQLNAGAGFATVEHNPATLTSVTLTELEPGTYTARFVVVDRQDSPKSSVPADISVGVPVDVLAAPNAVTDVQFVIL